MHSINTISDESCALEHAKNLLHQDYLPLDDGTDVSRLKMPSPTNEVIKRNIRKNSSVLLYSENPFRVSDDVSGYFRRWSGQTTAKGNRTVLITDATLRNYVKDPSGSLTALNKVPNSINALMSLHAIAKEHYGLTDPTEILDFSLYVSRLALKDSDLGDTKDILGHDSPMSILEERIDYSGGTNNLRALVAAGGLTFGPSRLNLLEWWTTATAKTDEALDKFPELEKYYLGTPDFRFFSKFFTHLDYLLIGTLFGMSERQTIDAVRSVETNIESTIDNTIKNKKSESKRLYKNSGLWINLAPSTHNHTVKPVLLQSGAIVHQPTMVNKWYEVKVQGYRPIINGDNLPCYGEDDSISMNIYDGNVTPSNSLDSVAFSLNEITESHDAVGRIDNMYMYCRPMDLDTLRRDARLKTLRDKEELNKTIDKGLYDTDIVYGDRAMIYVCKMISITRGGDLYSADVLRIRVRTDIPKNVKSWVHNYVAVYKDVNDDLPPVIEIIAKTFFGDSGDLNPHISFILDN